MPHSEPLTKEVGQEPDHVIERRRARYLGRILEFAPRLHSQRDPARIPGLLADVLDTLFPSCRSLIVLNGTDGSSEVACCSMSGEEKAAARVLAEEVARAGIPVIAADLATDVEGQSSCVPLRDGATNHGAVFVAVAYGTFSTSDELTGYLRQIAVQASLALRYAHEMRERREDLEVMATEIGGGFADGEVALSDAKRAFERWLIQARLKESNGNIAAAARTLKMDRGQLSRLVKRHGIDKSDYRD